MVAIKIDIVLEKKRRQIQKRKSLERTNRKGRNKLARMSVNLSRRETG